MLEKRIWSNLPYIFIILLICVAVWQIAYTPELQHYPNTVYTLYTQNSTGYIYPTSHLPLFDYSQLINLNFTFNILNLVCNDSSPLLLVLIHTSPRNFAKRTIIRETWGRNSNDIKVVFMIASVTDAQLQKEIEKENEIHNDFVQGSFLDTYRNITYKHVMVFKYVIYHCPQAKYILKTDDDVFVNMPTMISFLMIDLSPYGANNLLLCTPRKNSEALRSYRSKWRVSFREYPQRKYPTYCPGWTLLYSPDVVFRLYKEAQKTDYFWIDDIHITGTLAEKIHITHTDIETFVLTMKNIRYIVDYSYNISKPFLYGVPNLDERQIRVLWDFTKNRITPKNILKNLQIH